VTIEGDKQLSTSSEVRHNFIEMERSSHNNCYKMEEEKISKSLIASWLFPLCGKFRAANMKFV
jgi:hypothetical protein